MFSNTAYEALYQYLGLELHEKFIEILTSQRIFGAALLLIFAVMFFTTSLGIFSRYLPGSIVKRRRVPLSRYAEILFCLVVGISVLRVGADTGVERFDGKSWDNNAYIVSQNHSVRPTYRVSLVFDLLSRSAEELSALLSRGVDSLFKVNHSQLDAPDFFYKAVMYAGSATINDPRIKEGAAVFAEECLGRALPLLVGKDSGGRVDSVFRPDSEVDEVLSGLKIETPDHPGYDCLDAKNDIHNRLVAYTAQQSSDFRSLLERHMGSGINETSWSNMEASMALVNEYMDQHEAFAGIQKGSQPEGGAARVFQYLNRFFTWDNLTSMVTGRAGHGAALAAERSQEFSENLSRAPHVAGFIKMVLIALFPWLVFPVVAGYWRVFGYWFLLYLSVLLWTPVWTLLYHIMVAVSLSAEAMSAFGKLADGLSLYGASLITARMNYMFAVYSWLQLVVAAALTGGLMWVLRPVIGDTGRDEAPEFIDDARGVASGGAKAAGAVAAVF